MNKNILICGVGGQGTVLASKLIAGSYMAESYRVHSAETIGMAQRGGSVTSHIRIGEGIFSPLIPEGQSDLILGFEPAEAVRNLHYLKRGGAVIVSSYPVKPVSTSLANDSYDGKEMIAFLRENIEHTIVIDAKKTCEGFGSMKFFNIVILGVACGAGVLEINAQTVITEIERKVKEKFITMNKQAFALGMKIGDQYAVK